MKPLSPPYKTPLKRIAFFYGALLSTAASAQTMADDTGFSQLSQKLLYAVRTGDSTGPYVQGLAAADAASLAKSLSTDARKKAFWLNLYNAFVQKFLAENPERYKSRRSFFTKKQIVVAGASLSLDDIEHGLLRHSKWKWSLGYLNKPFPSAFEKTFRVDTLDSRIHFALNCGAKSCPPIAFYDPEAINRQLDLAAKAYLAGEAEKKAGAVYLPAFMSWFRADFGGKRGMRKLLRQYAVIGPDEEPKLRFKKYDWALFLNHYKTEN